MDTLLLIGIGALGVGATIQYFLGVKKNRWLGKRFSAQAEDTLHPTQTEYVNIGGAIGYNFKYKLRDQFREAKGTFTFFPRQSLLYMPASLLIGGSDRYFINLFTEKRLVGEGHLVEKGHLRRAKIDGIETMKRDQAQAGGREFVLLWKGADMASRLRSTLESFADPNTLVHFCCYDDNKTFFLYLKPKKEGIEANMRSFLEACPSYYR